LEALKQLNFICAQGLTSKCMLDIPAIKEGLTRIFKNGAPRELQQVFELLKHVQRSEFRALQQDITIELLNFVINHLTLVKTFVNLALFQPPSDEILIDQDQIVVIKLYMKLCIAICQHFGELYFHNLLTCP
jgi:hypothetical protein